MIREARYAGSWYPGTKIELESQLEHFFKSHELGPRITLEVNDAGERKIVAIISPHAGYVYSGAVAAHGFAQLALDGRPDLFVIVGINHRSYTPHAVSVYTKGGWKTPLGTAPIAEDVALKIVEANDKIYDDMRTHLAEHSLELQLPFIQYIYGPEIKIVPIIVSMPTLINCRILGNAISNAIQDENAVIIASTDFTHFEDGESAKKQDLKAIDAILHLDEELLIENVKNYGISMCGYGSTAATIVAAKNLNAKHVELLKYANSGDTTGDYSSVVGYASLKIFK
ncbi:MAG: AmmeMemoRadiSam system protein B [Candidatus Helarchaeales archaeon]